MCRVPRIWEVLVKDDTPVAVTSRSFANHPVLRKELLSRYSKVTFNESGRPLSTESLIDFLRHHVKAITALEVLDERVFYLLPELRVVSKYGVGLDMIDLDAMERHGVLIGWTGGVNRRSVAELAICSIISLLHRVPLACKEVKTGKWQQVRGHQLTGKTVGIIGCGHIGKDLAVLLKAFDCTILSYDIREFSEFYSKYQITPTGLEELLTKSDIVTLHLPLNDSTYNILNAERMGRMKHGSYLINAARGGLIDETKLKEMLMNGVLAGAALDVFMHEPPEDLELLHLPNVIITPHIGGSTEEAILAMGRAAIDGLDSASDVGKIVPDYLR
jgi:phosphoglycerate dehydrogenase-like enzyme